MIVEELHLRQPSIMLRKTQKYPLAIQRNQSLYWDQGLSVHLTEITPSLERSIRRLEAGRIVEVGLLITQTIRLFFKS